MNQASFRLAFAVLLAAVSVGGCAGKSSDLKPEQWRERLHAAMKQEVPSREKRDELSHVLVDAVDAGALDRLTRPDVEAAFGPAMSCESLPLCGEQGFQGSDWYYPIGHATDPKIKQLPLLIIAFDPHNRVSRAFAYRTH